MLQNRRKNTYKENDQNKCSRNHQNFRYFLLFLVRLKSFSSFNDLFNSVQDFRTIDSFCFTNLIKYTQHSMASNPLAVLAFNFTESIKILLNKSLIKNQNTIANCLSNIIQVITKKLPLKENLLKQVYFSLITVY